MLCSSSFFSRDPATTEIYTLSLHDALPISMRGTVSSLALACLACAAHAAAPQPESDPFGQRSEEHTSELQSRQYLVCRLLLEKKNKLQDFEGLADQAPFGSGWCVEFRDELV